MKPALNRRHLLCCGAAAAAGLFTSLASPPAQAALHNPCRAPGSVESSQQDWLARLWDGIDPADCWDVHAHLLGNGDAGSGCWLHPSLTRGLHPVERLRHAAILNAACVPSESPSVDKAYVQRLQQLAEGFPDGARWMLFAFDQACTPQGLPDLAHTTFHVPDAYARSVARAHPQRFGWVASIHPYRPDALERLESALQQGALALKWLPSAMGIDLREPRLRPLYDRLAQTRLPLIVHSGEEKAVPGAGRDDLGNPLHARVPLGHGVRVVMAHCASLGQALDTEARKPRPVPAFALFARLMDDPAYRSLLLGDISAVFQSNRDPSVWHTLLQRQDWHGRLLHGSDYPLPGLMPLHRTGPWVRAGLLDSATAERVDTLRRHNPLLADFALKRSVRWRGAGLQAAVFATRAHVQRHLG